GASGEIASKGVWAGVLDTHADELAKKVRRAGNVDEPVVPAAAGEVDLALPHSMWCPGRVAGLVIMVVRARRHDAVHEDLDRLSLPGTVSLEADRLLECEQLVEAASLVGRRDVIRQLRGRRTGPG